MKYGFASLLLLLTAFTTETNAQIGPSSNGPQYGPNWSYGFVPTPAAWQLIWTNKLDYAVGGLPIIYGGTGATSPSAALAALGGASSALPAANLFVGSTGGVATAKALSGDCTIAVTGALTCAQFSSSVSGKVPASGGGIVNFLRADGTWFNPFVSTALPTSCSGQLTGTFWNDTATVKVCP